MHEAILLREGGCIDRLQFEEPSTRIGQHRYDGLKKENSLQSLKLGKLDCRGEDFGSASFPQYGDSHGR